MRLPWLRSEQKAWSYILRAASLKDMNNLFIAGFNYLQEDFAQYLFKDSPQYDFVQRDNKKAFTFIKESADLGNFRAIYTAGMMYQYGIGTAISKPQALVYYEKLADDRADLSELLIKQLQ